MVVPLGSLQPVFTIPPLSEILDTSEDKPQPGAAIVSMLEIVLDRLSLLT